MNRRRRSCLRLGALLLPVAALAVDASGPPVPGSARALAVGATSLSAVLSTLALAAEETTPIPIQVGETIRAELPFGDPFETEVVFELQAASAGPLTIDARSLEFDPYVEVTRVGPEGRPALTRADMWGGTGLVWSRVLLRAEAGDLFRAKVQAKEIPYCGTEFEISVAEGEPERLDAEGTERAGGAYWDAAEARAEERGKAECEIRALIGRASLVPWNKAKEEGVPLAQRALALAEEQLGPEHPLVATSLVGLSRQTWRAGSREEALGQLARAITIYEKALGPEHLSIAFALKPQARRLQEVRRHDEAEAAWRRAVAILENRLGPDHIETGRVVDGLAYFLHNTGRWMEGRELAARALEIAESRLGDASPVFWTYLETLRYLHSWLGFHEEALDLAERRLELEIRDHGESHEHVVDSLRHVSGVLDALGRYDESAEYWERAKEILEHHGDSMSAWTRATMRSNMGHELMAMGTYSEALAIYEDVLKVVVEEWGRESGYYAWQLHYIAGALAAMGRDEEARELYEESLALRLKLKVRPQLIADSHSGLAEILRRTGHAEEAKEHLEEALRLLEERLGPGHPATAEPLRQLGEVLRDLGRLDEARVNAERASEIVKARFGPDHPSLSRCLNTLAAVLASAGDVAPALEAALEAEAISREEVRVIARSLPEREALAYASTRESGLHIALSLVAQSASKIPGSARSTWNALIASRALILDEMGARNRTLSEARKIAPLADRLQAAGSRLANLWVQPPGENVPVELYGKQLREARRDLDEAERDLAAQNAAIARVLARESFRLDDIATSIPPGGALVAFALYDRSEFTAGKTEAAGEPRPVAPPAAVPSYLAFVMRHGEGGPIAVPLGPAGEIDPLIARWQEEAGRGVALASQSHLGRAGIGSVSAEEAYRIAGEALRRMLWDPVAAHLAGSKRLFVVADGAVNLVNFAALPTGGGSYLVEGGPLIHYLSAERDLVQEDPLSGRGTSLLALGGADFDATAEFAALRPAGPAGAATSGQTATGPQTIAKATPARPVAETKADSGAEPSPETAEGGVGAAQPVIYRGPRSACTRFAAETFEGLPASAREVEEVTALWRERVPAAGDRPLTARLLRRETGGSESDDAPLTLTGSDATESAFKRRAPGRRILHLATHGFFLGGQCRSALDGKRGFGGVATADDGAAKDERAAREEGVARRAPDLGENPLLLSGLVLAGANNRQHAGRDEDDGILTAQEIAAMDLSSVEWAVLSACDTGVGEIRAGEGVFGLRRAFQVAGAGTLIMSLWPVEEDFARRWMKALYEARFQKRLDTAEAVREASLAVLNDRRARGLSDHPFYWAGFVAAGDWR